MLQTILKNALKAWMSSVLGLLIPIATGVLTDLASGHVNWSLVVKSLAPAGLLLVTDIFNELKKAVGTPDATQTPAS